MTKEQVLDIVNMYNNGISVREICKKYNKDNARIYEIINGKTWSEITGITYEDKRAIDENGKRYKNFKEEDILDIVEDYKKGLSKKEIAKKWNTTPLYVDNILKGRKWNNLTHIKETK